MSRLAELSGISAEIVVELAEISRNLAESKQYLAESAFNLSRKLELNSSMTTEN
ncbi:hypothetical protein ACIQXV_19365 [Neobacillus sp. NPDC097160]|uniref:hypothetical protein n=1 Tax=Neobacillus sp. NPDC097160 TaxID=3364298 RepID=UPI00380F3C52